VRHAAGASASSAKTPDSKQQFAYLRAAQAYMLISMPTATSTIFGAFQDIAFSRRSADKLRENSSLIGPCWFANTHVITL
jgi:hypothetical protein